MPRSKNRKSEAAWEFVGLTVKGNMVLLCSSIVGVDTSHACSRKGVGADKTMFPAVSFIHFLLTLEPGLHTQKGASTLGSFTTYSCQATVS